MVATEKEVVYQNANTYSVLNKKTPETKNIWMAFHGLGYLSRFFIKNFEQLNPKENYIVAPQAPSKYYQDSTYTYVGASWLTKENTVFETRNIVNYINAVATAEDILNQDKKLIVMGFSQGVSVALRWIAKAKVICNTIIIHSGGIPKELIPEDFTFLPENTRVFLLYGTQDQYITPERAAHEKERAETLFGKRLTILPFEGNHEVNKAFLKELVIS